MSWTVLAAEAAAPERTRAEKLQAEVKKLKEQLKDQEGRRAPADWAAEAQRTRADALEAEVAELRRTVAELQGQDAERSRAAEEKLRLQEQVRLMEEERQRFQDEREDWKREREGLQMEIARATKLREELRKRDSDLDELQEANRDLIAAKRELAAERDTLLERLETEQQMIMERVEKLELERAAAVAAAGKRR